MLESHPPNMTKTTAPLFSRSASGTVARTITFGNNRSGSFMRFRSMPEDPRTQKQLAYRSALYLLSTHWKKITAANQALWINEPTALEFTPYHAFVGFNLKRFATTDSLSQRPIRASLNAHAVYSNLAIENVDGHAVITFNITTLWGAWGIYLWRDSSTSVPMDLDHCIGVQRLDRTGGHLIVDIPSEPGHYYYQLRPFRRYGYWSPTWPELDVVV